ncbi:hypothetical protein OF83DRAFT_834715 [Amylostereum chailletii]|nr:hypothetical protein OF83DRAFT_834715 [Amylostereum chailletii]
MNHSFSEGGLSFLAPWGLLLGFTAWLFLSHFHRRLRCEPVAFSQIECLHPNHLGLIACSFDAYSITGVDTPFSLLNHIAGQSLECIYHACHIRTRGSLMRIQAHHHHPGQAIISLSFDRRTHHNARCLRRNWLQGRCHMVLHLNATAHSLHLSDKKAYPDPAVILLDRPGNFYVAAHQGYAGLLTSSVWGIEHEVKATRPCTKVIAVRSPRTAHAWLCQIKTHHVTPVIVPSVALARPMVFMTSPSRSKKPNPPDSDPPPRGRHASLPSRAHLRPSSGMSCLRLVRRSRSYTKHKIKRRPRTPRRPGPAPPQHPPHRTLSDLHPQTTRPESEGAWGQLRGASLTPNGRTRGRFQRWVLSSNGARAIRRRRSSRRGRHLQLRLSYADPIRRKRDLTALKMDLTRVIDWRGRSTRQEYIAVCTTEHLFGCPPRGA